jgi:hypothetical protein
LELPFNASSEPEAGEVRPAEIPDRDNANPASQTWHLTGPAAKQTRRVIDSLLSSYEERVSSIGSILDNTFQVLQDTQSPLTDLKDERERINAELRERLAKTSSLRRKDFDRMMQELLASQGEQEAELKDLLKEYVGRQKAIARELRDSLMQVRDSVAEDNLAAVRRLRDQLQEAPVRQEQSRTEICTKLSQLQMKQKVLTGELKDLLARGEDLRIQDFKLMLGRFNADRAKRLARQRERKEETRDLLAGFQKDQKERAVTEPAGRRERSGAQAQLPPSQTTNR